MNSNDPDDERAAAQLPDAADRFPTKFVGTPHPAVLQTEQLLRQCELRTQSRSGPGGQHRNRTSSGAFLQHVPTGIVGEATERRSQAQNRDVVIRRLRFRLALLVRTTSVLDHGLPGGETHEPDTTGIEAAIRQRYAGHSLRLNEQNDDKPKVLALVLNDLHAGGGQPSLAAKPWQVGTSRVVAFVRSHPAAFTLVNQIRRHHGRRPLK